MAATDEWTTLELTSDTSEPLLLNGRKLGLRWDASAPYRPDYRVNPYEIKVWGSVNGTEKNRLVEILAVGPQELNQRSPETAFFFYQGSISGLTVPYRFALVEFNTDHKAQDKGHASLTSNSLTAWLADAEPLAVAVPIQGFWGHLLPRHTPATEQVRDYARAIKFIDVTVFAEARAQLEYYEQSWDKMGPRLISTHSVNAEAPTIIRIRRGGFPRFSLLLRNVSEREAYCELVAIARDS